MHLARAAGGLALSAVLTLLVAAPSIVAASPIGSASSIGSPSSIGSASSIGAAAAATASQAQGLTLTRVTPAVATADQPISIGGVLDVAALGIDLSAAAPTLPATPTATPGTGGEDAPSDVSPPALEPVVSVDVRLGSVALTSHAAVSDWVAGQAPATGPVLGTADIVAAPDPSVDRLPFTVTVGGLGEHVRTAYGVVAVSVEIRSPGAAEPVAVRHTFLGYQERKEYVPLQLSWLVPFTLPADPVLLGEFGEERTSAWEELVGPDGSLSERLAAARVPHTGWVVDPALFTPDPAPEPADGETREPAESTPAGDSDGDFGQNSDGEQPSGDGASDEGESSQSIPPADGATSTPTGTSVATQPETPETEEPTPTEPGQPLSQAETEHLLRSDFAQALLEAVDGRDVLLLPMHDADIAALPPTGATGAGPTARRDLISAQLDAARAQALLEEHGARMLPTLWPADGAWGADRDGALRALDPGGTTWSVLAAPSSLTSTVRGPVTSSTGTPILPVDDILSARLSAAGDGTALETGLTLMADALVILNDRPGTTRNLIVLPDRESPWLSATAELTTVLAGVPWIELTSVPAEEPGSGPDPVDLVEAAEVPDPAQQVADPESVPEQPVLDDVRAGVLDTTLDLLPTAASVRAGTGSGSGADLATRGADSLGQLVSLRWRGHSDDWQVAYQPVADTVAATFTGLSIPSRDVTFLADTGLLRVTVENRLDADISNATLDLVVDHPILRVESGAQPVEVGADSRTTVAFEATSIATGRVQITATLRAPDGTVLAEPTTFTVRVSPTSDWIYWVLLALAGGVILIGIVRTTLRRRANSTG